MARRGLPWRGHEAREHDPKGLQEPLEVPYLVDLLDDQHAFLTAVLAPNQIEKVLRILWAPTARVPTHT